MKHILDATGEQTLWAALMKHTAQAYTQPQPEHAVPAEATLQHDISNLPVAERHISMSNELTRSAHRMGLAQKRIIALAIAKNDSKASSHIVKNQLGAWAIRITAKDYAEAYEVDIDKAYDQLKHAADTLMATSWELIDQTGRHKTRIKGPWLHWAKYHDGKGIIDIAFHPYVAPHLLDLKREFTTYRLKQAAALRSMYSWRLFECLQSWKTTGQWHVSVADFRQIMQTPKNYANDFGQIKRSVIEPAIRELTTKQNLIISWKPIKEGREVTELQFTFELNPQEQLDL